MNELLIDPTAARVETALTAAVAHANGKAKGRKVLTVSAADLTAVAAEAAAGANPAYRRVFAIESNGWAPRAVVVGWWTDHAGRRHVRVRAFASDWWDSSALRPAIGFVYPGAVFRVTKGKRRPKELAVCGCGAVGTPEALAWMGDRCGPCHDRAEETGVRPPLLLPDFGDRDEKLAFTPDGSGLVSFAVGPALIHVDLRTGVRTPMPKVPKKIEVPELVGIGPGGRCLLHFSSHHVAVWDIPAGTVGPQAGGYLERASLSPCGRFVRWRSAFFAVRWDRPDDPLEPLFELPWRPSGGGWYRSGDVWVGLTLEDQFERVELPSGAVSEIESAVFDDLQLSCDEDPDEPRFYGRPHLFAADPDHDLALVCVSDDEHGLQGPLYLGSLSGTKPWRPLKPAAESDEDEMPEAAVFSRCGKYLFVGSDGEGLGIYPTAGGEPTWVTAHTGGTGDFVRRLAVSPDGETLAVYADSTTEGDGFTRVLPWRRVLAAAGGR